MMKKTLTIILTFLIILSLTVGYSSAQDDTEPPTIIIISPLEYETIGNQTPIIKAEYNDNSGVDTGSVKIFIDQIDVTEWEETTITSSYVSYRVPEILKLKDGNHTVTIEVKDFYNNRVTKTWTFTVDTTKKLTLEEGIDLFTIITYIIYGVLIAFIIFILVIIYLKKTRRFTFKKFFARHPIQREVVTLYIPLLIGFFIIIFGLAYTARNLEESLFLPEYIFTVGIFVALAPYTISAIIERRKISKYEQAFAQFLFEMADAMRGGLDPTKAVIELAKTSKGILRDHLVKASENIKIGRPFEEVMAAMVKPIKSELVKRYATLIGESSKIGGETSLVIYRTAKDMDDFIKINQERRRQLTAQITTMYIAFGVLLIILYQLIIMFPSMSSMDISLLGATSLESTEATQSAISRMSIETMKRRFLHLMIINSLGTGTLMGMLVDGKIKYGLIHSLILTISSVVFFALLIL
ncbi:MAG: type II secretion system F family protein [Candidatus Thermoplasmatota archaeon]